MGVYEGRGGLTKATRELLLRWQDTKSNWQDAVADQFEKKYLEMLEKDVKTAVGAMDQMAALLSRIRNDCQ